MVWGLSLSPCLSPRPGSPLMGWSMSALRCGNHFRRDRLGRIYGMHSLARTGEHTSISNDTSVALRGTLSLALLRSFLVETTLQAVLTRHKAASSWIDWRHVRFVLLMIDFIMKFGKHGFSVLVNSSALFYNESTNELKHPRRACCHITQMTSFCLQRGNQIPTQQISPVNHHISPN